MSRKWLETMHGWPALDTGRGHEVRIAGVERNADLPGMRVLLGFVTGEQVGRTVPVVLVRPYRPEGLTAGLLAACGVRVAAGMQFSPLDLVGRTVVGFFTSTAEGELMVSRFEAGPAGAGG